MSVKRPVVLVCDKCGEETHGEAVSPFAARLKAAHDGWTYIPRTRNTAGRDICPRHN